MGKGFNNYMCKKFFHPASRDNLKRVWMAEQKSEAYKQKQEELRVQYEKEQDVFNNKALVSKESKEKLSVNFMYEPPPGMKKDHVKEEGEPEFKFEWQRKYNAPRESYCKGDQEINDQPFGIPVRNVRCLKCRKWGHLNTDRECPLFASFSGVEAGSTGNDTFSLMRQMREDGLQMKRSAVNTLDSQPVELEPEGPSEQTSDPEDISEQMEIVKSLSVKQKKKLLKKIKKLEKEKKRMKKEKLSQSNKSSRGHHRHDSDSDEEVVVKMEKRSPAADDRELSKMYNRRERRQDRSLSRESVSDSGEELASPRGLRSGYERSNGAENKTQLGGGSSKKYKGDGRRDDSVEKQTRVSQRGESGKSRIIEDREMRGDRRRKSRDSQDRRRADSHSDSENETRNGYKKKPTKSDKKQARRERSGSRDRKHKRNSGSDFDDERVTRRSPKREYETKTSKTSNGKERRRDRSESEDMKNERKTKSSRDDEVIIKKENITPDREVREKIRRSHDKEKRKRSKSRDKSNKSEKREDRREERKRRHSDSD